jgi:hypothetical protein
MLNSFVYDALQSKQRGYNDASATQTSNGPQHSLQTRVRTAPGYIAAIRYLDGSSDLFHVRNADDLDDARALVIAEVGEVRSIWSLPCVTKLASSANTRQLLAAQPVDNALAAETGGHLHKMMGVFMHRANDRRIHPQGMRSHRRQ